MNYELRTIVRKEKAFSLVEAVTALIILAVISSGVVVVISRCIASAADSQMRMQAFEVARENMEKLLASSSVKETTEYGDSDKYPEIKWQTVVETFYEPITARMWVRGVCSAEYTDTEGQTQTVELTHWLTDVTKEQLLQILANKEKEGEKEQALLGVLVVKTVEAAAAYAGVDVPTVQKWVEDGMVTMEDGSFVKKNLDIFKESNGNPPPEVKSQQVKSEAELVELTKEQAKEQTKEQTKEKEQELLGSQAIETVQAAAEYAGVDVPTVQKWVEDGMVTIKDGSFVKKNLDIFKASNGNPTTESKKQQVKSEIELKKMAKEQTKEQVKPPGTEEPADDDWLNQIEPTTGLTYGELEKMSFQQVWELFMSKMQQR